MILFLIFLDCHVLTRVSFNLFYMTPLVLCAFDYAAPNGAAVFYLHCFPSPSSPSHCRAL